MRTRLTIDSDAEHLLRGEAARSRYSSKVVSTEAIRHALAKPSAGKITVRPLFQAVFPSEFESQSMNHLADQLNDVEILRELLQ